MNTDVLTRDHLLALANAHLLRVVPGSITGMSVEHDVLTIQSVLPSVFEDHGPSRWQTTIDLRDGETLACDVVEQSRCLRPGGHVPGGENFRPL